MAAKTSASRFGTVQFPDFIPVVTKSTATPAGPVVHTKATTSAAKTVVHTKATSTASTPKLVTKFGVANPKKGH